MIWGILMIISGVLAIRLPLVSVDWTRNSRRLALACERRLASDFCLSFPDLGGSSGNLLAIVYGAVGLLVLSTRSPSDFVHSFCSQSSVVVGGGS